MNGVDKTQADFSKWLLNNRVFAWVVTVLVLFTVTTAVPASVIEEITPVAAWVAVVAGVLMVCSAVTAVLLPRIVKRRAHDVLGLSWTFAIVPVLIGIGGFIYGAGQWLPGLGWLLAIASLSVAMRRARQSFESSAASPA